MFSSPSFTAIASDINLTGGGANYETTVTYLGNGNVLGSMDSSNGNWMYGYDTLNRLTSAYTFGGASRNLGYSYDQYGNGTCSAQNPVGTCTQLSYTNPSTQVVDTNRMYSSGYAYDTAGNLIRNGKCNYAYNAEGLLASVSPFNSYCPTQSTVTYLYSEAGTRVGKKVAGVTTEIDMYDLGGHLVSAFDGSGNLTRGEIYAGNQHVATYTNGTAGTTYFNHADWLGTERARSRVAQSLDL